MIASVSKTKEILSKYELQAKKRFGQNFLIDSNIVKKIVDTSNVNENTIVIEIGPGIGAMTELLAEKAKKVICFEIDSDMVEIITNEVIGKGIKNVEVKEIDFLKVDLKDYDLTSDRIIVVSNLPYYITTPIIFKLLGEDIVTEIYVMVQDEVARRLVGMPGTKDYGSLSVMINFLAEAKFEFKVGRNCFLPAPNVDSAIVSIKRKKNDYRLKKETKIIKFIQDIFEIRRKTLINNILKKMSISRDEIESKLIENDFDINVRSESLSLDQIVKLYQMLGLDK